MGIMDVVHDSVGKAKKNAARQCAVGDWLVARTTGQAGPGSLEVHIFASEADARSFATPRVGVVLRSGAEVPLVQRKCNF